LEWGGGLKTLKTLSFNPPQKTGKGGVTITPVKKGGVRTYEATQTLPDGSVVNYVLDEQLMKEAMQKGDSLVVLNSILSARSFNDPNIRKYWVQVEPKVNTKTTPEDADAGTTGSGGGKKGKHGYKANFELSIPDPMLSNRWSVDIGGDYTAERLKGEWKVSKVVDNISAAYSVSGEIYR